MRGFFSFSLVVLALSSCAVYDPASQLTVLKAKDAQLETAAFATAEDIERWICENVEYVTDEEKYGKTDYWASPMVTLDSMQGDCEDLAGLFLYMVYANFGVKGTCVMVRLKVKNPVTESQLRSDGSYHMQALVGGTTYFGVKREGTSSEVVRNYSYDEMRFAWDFGGLHASVSNALVHPPTEDHSLACGPRRPPCPSQGA
jgi:hypothetical protein